MKAIRDFGRFCARSAVATLSPPYRPKDVLKQLEFVGWQSAPVVVFSVCFAAMVAIKKALAAEN